MELHEMELDVIDMSFERFRIVDPRADARMIESIKTHGQLSPMFAGSFGKKTILIDGFKRYRAIRSLGKATVRLFCVKRSISVLKAIALSLNRDVSPFREIEEALLLHSLHYEDGLRQTEIALQCNRHKSWVCRRIALIERLSEEVLEQLRLGLLPISTARELLRLPRGNQRAVLQSIQSNHLSTRQSRRLVECYLDRQAWQRQKLLDDPYGVLTEQERHRIDCSVFTPVLLTLLRGGYRLAKQLAECGIGSLSAEQRCRMERIVQQVCSQCVSVIEMITMKEKSPCP